MSASINTDTVGPTLFLTDRDVSELHNWKDAIAALRAAYAAPINDQMVPPRSVASGHGTRRHHLVIDRCGIGCAQRRDCVLPIVQFADVAIGQEQSRTDGIGVDGCRHRSILLSV